MLFRSVAIGKMYDNMPNKDMSPKVLSAYKSLVKIIAHQYKKLPIRIYAHGEPMISKDNMGKYNDLIAEAKRIRLDKTITDEKIRTGKLEKIQKKIEKLVEFKPNNYDDAYANSREMQHDVVEENKMRFFTGGFGDASENIDYTGHPLLDKTEFKTTPIEVIDNGKLLENAFGEPLRVSRELTYNDVFRVVHDYIAHAGTAAT